MTGRTVVVGIGAVGGLIAARVAQAGLPVLAVARGEHGRVVRRHGLTVESPLRTDVVPLDVADVGDDLRLAADDVVLLCVKSHQTHDALARLRHLWPRPLPVVCVQNGVANEPAALRLTPDVVACNVLLPATHLEPGHVVAHWAPLSGLLDVGPWPAAPRASPGAVAAAEEVAARLAASTFGSVVQPDIMRWKHAKLLMNLGNAVEAVCGPTARGGPLSALLVQEGRRVLAAAGVVPVELDEIAARTRAAGDAGTGGDGAGGSTWQSIQRGAVDLETDYLNGEIVLLGRRHGVPTPVNEAVAELATRWAQAADRSGAIPEARLYDALRELDAPGDGHAAPAVAPYEVVDRLLPRLPRPRSTT